MSDKGSRIPEKKVGKKRPCLRCGKKFQPTEKRSRLCRQCYKLATEASSGYDEHVLVV